MTTTISGVLQRARVLNSVGLRASLILLGNNRNASVLPKNHSTRGEA